MEADGERESDDDDESNHSDDDESDSDSDDVECLDLNQETLVRLQRNDPNMIGLKVGSDTWIEGTGLAIAKSLCLKRLKVDVESDDHWLAELSTWLTCNETIERITLKCESGVLGSFSPFFLNNRNLRCIDITNKYDLYTPNLSSLAVALSNCKSDRLESISFLNLNLRSAGDQEVEELFHSLKGKPRLAKISLNNNTVERLGCKALANLLKSPSTNIQELDLSHSSIDNDDMAILCGAIIKSKTLQVLSLASNSLLSVSGFFSLSTVLSHPITVIHCLLLDRTGLDDEGISFLGDALKINKTLYSLSLRHNESITLEGWKAFSKCFTNPQSELTTLFLCGCNIDDEGAATLATALATNTSLTKLNMSKNTRITSRGLVAFFNLLLDNKKSALETLVITNNNIDVEGMGWEDWDILSRALCDKTDIMSTFTSNHTFYSLGLDNLPDYENVWEEIYTLLELNNHFYDAARQKILKYHFCNGRAGVHPLACLHETVLPYAIEWMGTDEDNDGYSTIFAFVQSFPSFFNVSRTKPARSRTKKRKGR